MSELRELQNQFQDYLLHSEQDIQHQIVGTRRVPAETRLGIYGFAYRYRLLEALMTNYPILKTYLGDEFFERLGYDFVHECPSTYRSIRWYGESFKNFLSVHPEMENLPWVLELVEFEWTLSLAFDSADANVISMEDIAAVSPELWPEMRFKTHPSAHRLQFHWNVVALWQSLMDEQAPPSLIESPAPVQWIAWRQALSTRFCSVPDNEAWAIDAVISGASFGELCEYFYEQTQDESCAMQVAALMKGWVSAGFLTGVVLP